MTARKAVPSAHTRKRNGAPKARRIPEDSSAQFPKRTLKALLITLGIGLGLILVCSLIAYFLPDPDPMIRPLAYIAAGLTSLVGGIVAGKIHGHAPAVCGTLNGALLLAIMLLLSLFFRSLSSGLSVWLAILLHAAVPLFSFLGALIGVKRR